MEHTFNSKIDGHAVEVAYEAEAPNDIYLVNVLFTGTDITLECDSLADVVQDKLMEQAQQDYADMLADRADYISDLQRDIWADHADRCAAVRELG